MKPGKNRFKRKIKPSKDPFSYFLETQRKKGIQVEVSKSDRKKIENKYGSGMFKALNASLDNIKTKIDKLFLSWDENNQSTDIWFIPAQSENEGLAMLFIILSEKSSPGTIEFNQKLKRAAEGSEIKP